MQTLPQILKEARYEKELTTRKLAEFTAIDQALISKFENGYRIPTRKQVQLLADNLDINLKTVLVAWYKVKLQRSFDINPFAIQAISEILQEKGIDVNQGSKKEEQITEILDELEALKRKLTSLR